MKFPDVEVGKRLFCGLGDPNVLGIGTFEIRGSAYIEGPQVIGDPRVWPSPPPGIGTEMLPLPPTPAATLMVGPTINLESPVPIIICAPPPPPPPIGVSTVGIGSIPPPPLPELLPLLCCPPNNPYSLAVSGPSAFLGIIDTTDSINAGGEVTAMCGGHRLSAKKNFDIPHPTKDGWRLTHTCVEGPEASVYIRGRVTNRTEIELPLYWKDLVDIQSITVNLTPIGAHQDVIIKRWDEKKIYLQAKGGMPIDCFYYIMAERKDTEKLIPEYQGAIEDYPGDNSQRSIVGYHYDSKRST